uniref:Calponin-homology (CH) domain-containing protein n=1 Tax=Varanus komodoensis TaxID=61221 RepID=A0A8D2Q5W8_VARKO
MFLLPVSAVGFVLSSEAAPKGNQEQQPAPEEAAAKEKKKRPTFDRRELTRPRMPPRVQSRKAIVEKFGGAATGPAPNIKRTGGANTVKNMLLEWCRAKTRGYEHVDIQNFSTSWSSGMAFCALIHKFFPDAFDYAALDPANRRENFALAFSTAEQKADCAQLLEVDDMVRMKVPDNKCIYTYIQELYRSLVAKGLVKTKQK